MDLIDPRIYLHRDALLIDDPGEAFSK